MTTNSSIQQWLLHGGSLSFASVKSGRIRCLISDSGGSAPGWSNEVTSFDRALEWAEGEIRSIIRANENMLDCYRKGELPWPEESVIHIPGLPPVYRNE